MKLRAWLEAYGVDAFLILSEANRRYFTGFTGSNGAVVVTQDEAVLITDQRYTEQAMQEAKGFRIVTHGIDPFETFQEVLKEMPIKKVAYETKRITDYQLRSWKQICPNVKWIPTEDVGMKLRAVKEADEIVAIQKALSIAEHAFLETIELIRPGMTEWDVKVELEYRMQKYGSEGVAFDTIVASGKRSSLPHGGPTQKVIESGDPIVIDFGATYGGYRSDVTRTVWVGKPDSDLYRIFEQVVEAQEKAVNAIQSGMTGMAIDDVHRKVFKEYGIEQYSLRGLGHGVGLEIHEEPRVVIQSEGVIEKGMIFTVEPGIYIPDVGGIRTEDMVLVTDTGASVLTSLPKRILISE